MNTETYLCSFFRLGFAFDLFISSSCVKCLNKWIMYVLSFPRFKVPYCKQCVHCPKTICTQTKSYPKIIIFYISTHTACTESTPHTEGSLTSEKKREHVHRRIHTCSQSYEIYVYTHTMELKKMSRAWPNFRRAVIPHSRLKVGSPKLHKAWLVETVQFLPYWLSFKILLGQNL